jgi:hypothetical protein
MTVSLFFIQLYSITQSQFRTARVFADDANAGGTGAAAAEGERASSHEIESPSISGPDHGPNDQNQKLESE